MKIGETDSTKLYLYYRDPGLSFRDYYTLKFNNLVGFFALKLHVFITWRLERCKVFSFRIESKIRIYVLMNRRYNRRACIKALKKVEEARQMNRTCGEM